MRARPGWLAATMMGCLLVPMVLAVPAFGSRSDPSASPTQSPQMSSSPAPPPSATQSSSAAPSASDPSTLQSSSAAPSASDPSTPSAAPTESDAPGRGDDDGPEGRTLRKQTTSVNVVDDSFTPGQITVDAGTTITWSNSGQNPHTVTADDGSFDSGTMQAGDTFSSTFGTSGTFAYHCTIHGGPGGIGMSGVVVVRGTEATDGTGGDGGGETTTDGTADLPATGASVTTTTAGAAAIVLAVIGLGAVVGSRAGWPHQRRAPQS